MECAAHPLSSGKAVASSAVTSASGTLHTKGRIRNPSSASSGPPDVTASCTAFATLLLAMVHVVCKAARWLHACLAAAGVRTTVATVMA